MAEIILRSSRPAGIENGLTNNEIDANFSNLNTQAESNTERIELLEAGATPQALTDGATIAVDVATGYNKTLSFGSVIANRDFTFSNLNDGGSLKIRVANADGQQLTFPAGYSYELAGTGALAGGVLVLEDAATPYAVDILLQRFGPNIEVALVPYKEEPAGGSTVTDSTVNGNILVDGAEIQVFTPTGLEPAFSKNTAFNKNFGTTAGTVSEGNHTHTQYLQKTTTPSAVNGVWSGTQAQYDAITTKDVAILYFISA